MKRVLIPLWVIQILILLAFTAASALALYAVDTYSEEVNLNDSVQRVLKYVCIVKNTYLDY